ncbi:MAG: proliferating cell nuclear antigen (pcna) [Candidatus Aenigmarchaeota archaeon]|nr:proliferating cell nuclear antigen (pcna) [Candidatus Aenigmarchaeota archaeon]
MFEATLNDIALLRDSLGAVAELIDETELRIKESGIEMVAADKAVVAVIDFFMHRNAFSDYKYESDATIGLNLLNFMQVLRRAVPGDALTLRLEDKKLHVILASNSTRKFVLPLIDVSKEETPDLGKLEAGFTSFASADAGIITAGIDDAELIADSVVFTVRKEQLMLKSEGDASSVQLEIPQGDSFKVVDMNEPVRARYSIDYLKKIFKARKISDHAQLALSTDYPLKIQFEVPEKVRLSFILAPRVEEG